MDVLVDRTLPGAPERVFDALTSAGELLVWRRTSTPGRPAATA
jgi:uncharacterized protein YndB with AHSA1/START domain